MSHRSELSCYRVPLRLRDRTLSPIVAASSPEEATERAQVLGEDLFKKSVPWQMDRGINRPPPDVPYGRLANGHPIVIHVGGNHR